MKKILVCIVCLTCPALEAQACDWTGQFSSSFGQLLFQQSGDALVGDYVAQNGAFAGRINDCALEGVFLNERSGQFGPVQFRLDDTGTPRLIGKWGEHGRAVVGNWTGQLQSQLPPRLTQNSCAWTGKWFSNFGQIQVHQQGRSVSGTVNGQRMDATFSQSCSLIGVVDFTSGARGFKIERTGDQMAGKLFPLTGGQVQDWRGQRVGPADPKPGPAPSRMNPAKDASASVMSRTTYRLPRFGQPAHSTDPRYTSKVGLVPSAITSAMHASGQTFLRIRACDQRVVDNVRVEAAIRGGARPNTTQFLRGTRCFLEFDPEPHGEGTYTIDLTVTATEKATGASVSGQKSLSVDYKVVWIAVVGDSFASGEGAPLRPVNHTEARPERARWLHASERILRVPGQPNTRINPHCNVSPNAWPMKTAEALAEEFPDAVFKVSNFACSGSVIARDGDLVKINTAERDEYGQRWQNARFSQLRHLSGAIQSFGRNPDYIFLSAGINNGDFVKVINTAAAEDLFSHVGKAELTNRALHVSQLRDLYDALHARLRPLVSDPSRIVLVAYPDFTRNSAGQEVGCRAKLAEDATPRSAAGTQCDMTMFPVKIGPWNAGFDKLTEVSGREWKLANSAFAQPLFDQQEFAALRHGWTFVRNTALQFRGRGICAAHTAREMNQPCDAIRAQGQLQGAFHPNAKGHARVADNVAGLLRRRLSAR